jgi:cytosine deaminase
VALVIRKVRLLDGSGPTNVLLEHGLVAAVGADTDGAVTSVDGTGCVVLPGLVDAHLHLDKAFLWDDPLVHGTSRGEAFAAFRKRKADSQKPEIKARMLRALRLASQHGVTALRAQVDVDEQVGLLPINAALELRAECADWITVQVVAFPQEGLLSQPGVLPLVRLALARGADAVGGGAGLDSGVPAADHLHAVFDLAHEFNVEVDLHPDITSGPDRQAADWELADIARLTQSTGWERRVAVAHLSGVGAMPAESAHTLANLLRDHGISVVTVPGAEFHAAAAWRHPPVHDVRRAITNVPLLLAAGVNVCMATGHVRDPLNPFGQANPLADLLLLLGAVSLGEPTISGVPAVDLITAAPRRALGLPDLWVNVGEPADLVVVETAEPEAIPRGIEHVRYVLKSGRVVWPAS